jgi:hypothetical protein
MTDIEKAKDMMKRMKGDVREVINNYATETNTLANKGADPHTPVIAAMQMALANAAVDYLVLCGMTPPEALQTACNVTGIAMQQWLDTVLRLHKLKAETKTNIVGITDAKNSIN